MRTISQVVEDILQHSPFLSEAVADGIANSAQVARRIRPEVEKRLYEKVSEASIAMAIHRLRARLRRAPAHNERLLKRMRDITVRSGLVEFTCESSGVTPQVVEALSRFASRRNDAFFHFSRGMREFLVIASAEFGSEVEKVLKRQKGLKKTAGLSAITMHLPESSLNVPGMYYPVLRAIAHEGISFEEVTSVRTEFSIIFADKDIDRAFATIKRVVS